jgi:hypothetical protein
MNLKLLNKELKKHKSEMAKKFSMKNDPRFDDLYQNAWTNNINEGIEKVEQELVRILEENRS